MKRRYDPLFVKALKKTDVRIRKSFKEKIVIFAKNPYDPVLNNHELKREYAGYRSIDITNDWRAIYEEVDEETAPISLYFLSKSHSAEGVRFELTRSLHPWKFSRLLP